MSISEKSNAIRMLIEFVISITPEIVALIKEFVSAIREIKSV